MFEKQLKYIDELERNVDNTFEKTIIDYGFVLKDYIINKQLFREGIDGNGKKLAGYTRTTIRMKIAKGDPTDRTTLRDRGEFYAHIEINAFSDRFEVTSNVPYDQYIFKRYGRDILKITKENMMDFMFTYFLPNLKNHANNIIAK
jgi:hypothetical protein